MAEGTEGAEGIRIGVIVPSVNIVVEDWYPAVAPEGVSLPFARMLMPPAPRPTASRCGWPV
jgi:maleate cis-trans isomerase